MMTKNEKIRTVLFVIAGLLLGIIVGVLVNDTKIDNEDANAEIASLKAVSDSLFNTICEDLLSQHKTLKNQIIINMQAGMFSKFYNQHLSFEQNLKDPMVGGAMKGLIHQAFPESFAEYDKLIKRLKHLEK
mgnify:CR=1 FL=1